MSKAKQAKKALDALDLSLAARMKRANEMGFDTSQKFYHGGAEGIESFKPSHEGHELGRGVYFTDKDTASGFGSKTYETLHRGKYYQYPYDPEGSEAVEKILREKGWNDERINSFYESGLNNPNGIFRTPEEKIENWREFQSALRDAGYSGIDSEFSGSWQRSVFDPKDIRSTNAKFDPKKKNSGNILDSMAPLAVAGAGGYAALSGEDAEAAPGDKLQAIAKTLKNTLTKVELKDGNKIVGSMGLSRLPEEMMDRPNDFYRHINWSEIDPAYRGHGYYPQMLDEAVKSAKSEGLKGIKTTAQTKDSARVWDKIENKKQLEIDPGSANQYFALEDSPRKKLAMMLAAGGLGASSQSWADDLANPIASGVGDTVGNALETVDKYTGNPIRAAAKGLIERKNPFQEALDSVLQNRMTSGNDVARAYLEKTPGMGIPMPDGTIEYPAEDVIGLAADVVLDPTNAVPVGAIKKAPKVLKTISKLLP